MEYSFTKPRGELHTMWNAGPDPARIIEVISPAGFEHFFREMAELAAAGPPQPLTSWPWPTGTACSSAGQTGCPN